MNERRYRLIDLFAGAGGMTLGFISTDRFTPVFAVESDPDAAATYGENFSGHVRATEIEDVSTYPAADVIIGGPPCQSFSSLGTQDPDDPRKLLWREFMRVVKQVRPLAFIIENVPGFLKTPQYEALCEYVEETVVGPYGDPYQISAGVLNASAFGVPQSRRRGFVVGAARHIGLPKPNPDGPLFGGGPTLRNTGVLDGLADPTSFDLVDGPPFSGLDLHLARRPKPVSLQRYRHIPAGGNRFDLPRELQPPCWRSKTTGTTDGMGRLWWDRPASTIRTEFYKPEKGRYLHPTSDRSISHLEAARIQTFPDDFKWHGTKISIARQIGNAVPPLLAEAVARHLALALDGEVDVTTEPGAARDV